MTNITIAIDGYSSTGKSTIAKRLANHLGYVYVDSGAMYRAATLFAMEQKCINEHEFNKDALINLLPEMHLEFKFNPMLEYSEMYLNSENVESQIRTIEVSRFVSLVSAVPEVRKQLVALQHKMGKNKGIVMDGRDIGTVVFPDAELKIFMTASAEVRARRRFDELIGRGDKVTYAEVLKNVTERDRIDSTRETSPLVQASDAIVMDNSNMTLDQQYTAVLDLVNKTLNTK